MSTTLLKARATRLTAPLALPDCFAEATAAAEAILLDKPAGERTAANRRDLRRVASKARRLR